MQIPKSTVLFFLVAAYCDSAHAASDLLDCVYIENSPTAEIEAHRGCARRVNGRIHIQKNHLARMSFDADGLAWMIVSGQHYYVKRNGSVLPVITYDNGPDPFQEGLARSRVNGRIAYYDASFRQRIPPRFDWGFPFENGLAWVCRGCKKGPPDLDGHIAMLGGQWGCIDKAGHEVVPVSLSASEAAAIDCHAK
jgi:hypothetical protein